MGRPGGTGLKPSGGTSFAQWNDKYGVEIDFNLKTDRPLPRPCCVNSTRQCVAWLMLVVLQKL